MRKLKFVCAQPATTFYIWQVETVINNFLKNGVHASDIDILLAVTDDTILSDWIKLSNHYNNVNFLFYNDTREDKSYLPGVYFYLLKKYVESNDLTNTALFLHDSDIVFTKPVDFKEMCSDDVWYMSDTNSYINYDYIQSKGNHVYEDMCDIIGIDKLIPKLMNSNSGGAQYIVKNTTADFWDKVEKDSLKLYNHFCATEHLHIQKNDHDYPIQKWTAGMWAILWNAWLHGHETKVDSRLDFGWSTNPISDVDKYCILHNSGVLSGNDGLFFKTDYLTKLPYKEDLKINQDKASYYYWMQVQEAGLKSPMINNLKNIFTEIYSNNSWTSSQSVSGIGSEHLNVLKLIEELPILLEKYNINSILDIPCGDFNWMPHVDLKNISYIGADIVDDLVLSNKTKYPSIDFRVLDITTDELPMVDLVFVRDCLGHLSNENVLKAIENIKKSGSKFLLATSYTKYNFNTDIENGGWKCINLMIDPFFLIPIYLINEDCKEGYPHYTDKCMILFKLND